MQAQTQRTQHTVEAHAVFTCNFSSLSQFSGVYGPQGCIYTTNVSTILKHIFFAIESGFSAAASCRHILYNSGHH